MKTNLLEKFCLRFPRLAIQLHIGHVKSETLTIQTRTLDDVPKEMHESIRQRARQLNMEVDEYLAYLRLPPEQKMPLSEWAKTIEPIGLGRYKNIDVVALIHEAREEREEHLYSVVTGNVNTFEGD